MFRKMRRAKQELSHEECIAILERGNTGVFSVIGDEGYPYTVPLNYVYDKDKIYFHCAVNGHKTDSIKANEKVSFCVIDKDEVIPEDLATSYQSVIVFGKAKIIDDKDEIYSACEKLGLKYNPDKNRVDTEINNSLDALCCVEIKIEHMTGKESLDLMRKR